MNTNNLIRLLQESFCLSIRNSWIIVFLFLQFNYALATQYTFLGTEDSLYNNPNNWSNQTLPPFAGILDTIIFSPSSECLIRHGESLNGDGYTMINFGKVINYGYVYLKSGKYLNQSQSTWENHGEMWLTSVLHLENAVDANFENFAKLIHRFCDFDNFGNLLIQDSIFSGAQGNINNHGLLSVNSCLQIGTLHNFSKIENNIDGEIKCLSTSINDGEICISFGSRFIASNIFTNQGIIDNESDSCVFQSAFRNDSLVNNWGGAHIFIFGGNPNSAFENHGRFRNEFSATLNLIGFINLPSDGVITNYGLIIDPTVGHFTNNGSLIQEGQLDLTNMGFFHHGVLSGSGSLICESAILSGKCEPGGNKRKLTINSSSTNTLGDTSILVIEIGNLNNDTLATNQEISISGILSVELLPGFVPMGCSQFTILTYKSLNTFDHAFDSLNFPKVDNFKWEIEYRQTEVVLHLLPHSSTNNCLDFGNINDHCLVEIPHSIGTLRTIEFRFHPSDTDPALPGQVLFNFNHSPYHYIKYLDDNQLIQGETLTIFDTNGWLYTDYPFQSRWYHIAIVSDGTLYKKIYIDGSEVPTYNLIDYPGEISATHMLLGAGINEGSDSSFFSGKIDEVRLWNISLSETFIKENYFKEVDPATGGILAYYQMNQGLANGENSCINQLKDLSQYDKHGTLINFNLSGINCNWGGSTTCAANFPQVNIFTGADMNAPSDWSQNTNWSAGIPTPCQYVLIPAGKTVEVNAESASCYQIEIQAGGSFINNNAILEILAPNH